MKKKIWVFAEQVRGRLDSVVFELITKAMELGDQLGGETEVGAVLLGGQVKGLAGQLADEGVEIVYVADDPALSLYNPLLYAPVITDLVKKEEPEIFLFGATSIGAELGPTVAVALETGVAAHCVELKINGEKLLVADVPSFGGKILGEILCPNHRPQMASVKPGIFIRGESRPKPLNIQSIDLSSMPRGELPLKALSLVKKEIEGVPLEKAEIVFCGGYGLGSQGNWNKLVKLASLFGGATAATRPAIDEGWAPGEHMMVGTSGKSIRPKVYIGFGISGATHHICGMKDSGLIISVNNDEDAAVFQVSDVAVKADLNKILDHMLAKFVSL